MALILGFFYVYGYSVSLALPFFLTSYPVDCNFRGIFVIRQVTVMLRLFGRGQSTLFQNSIFPLTVNGTACYIVKKTGCRNGEFKYLSLWANWDHKTKSG